MASPEVVPLSSKRRSPRQTLRERVAELMPRYGISQSQLADEIGMSKSVVSEWLRGNYDHQSDIVPAVQAWMSRLMATHGDFLDLQNSRRVIEACEFAIRKRRMVVVVGPPGLGKTMALREFHRQQLQSHQEVIYHYTSPVIRQQSLARMIARRLQLSESGSAFDIVERIVARMKRKPAPMLFDEANHLNVKCLEILRYLWDQVHVPLILAGSMKLERTLSEASVRDPEVEQLQSRMALRVLLVSMRPTETRKFVEAHFTAAELGDRPKAVLDEFQSWSRGIIRDLANGIEASRELMKLNDEKVLSPELVKTAFHQRLLTV